MAASQWAFKTASETAAALAAKSVSAVELTQATIDRIEKYDAKINAICVRDFSRALEAARAADAAIARGERRPLLGIPMTIKESYNLAGHPDDLGLRPAKGLHPEGRRAERPARQDCRRRDRRQDQRPGRAGRLAELQRDLRRHQQPLRYRPHAGRLIRRLGGGARRGLRTAVARHRHRRLAAGARALLRGLCPQADPAAGPLARPYATAVAAAAGGARPCGHWSDGALGQRSRAAARRHRRA